ncbi:MAG: SRPBCC family protein [Solirubrobacterales bacterium]
MASYTATVVSPRPIDDVFGYLADFSTAPEWDENTVSSELTSGDPFVAGAKYEVVTEFGGRELTLTYETVEIERPARVVLESGTGMAGIRDTMTFKSTPDGGTEVTYEANVSPNGFAKVLDPVFSLIFKRVGDKAVKGLRRELDAK